MEYHNIEPVYDENSTILILGSFPSVKSRQAQFFYKHPQNRFWKVLAKVFASEVPVTILQKQQFLHLHHIALWDVIASCEIQGSSDASIKQVKPNDLNIIFKGAKIKHVYTNGQLAYKYYQRYFVNDFPAISLPSTSPANARYSLEKLVAVWKIIKDN